MHSAASEETGRRRDLRRQGRREVILDAAQRVFARRGPLAASVTEVAQESNYSKAAIYTYFRNKEEIYLALVLQGQTAYYDLLKERLSEYAERPGLENLRAIWDCLLELAAEQPDFFTLTSALQSAELAPTAPPELVEAVNQRARDVFGLIRQVIRSGIERGEFAPVPEAPTALAIWAAFTGGLQLYQTQQQFTARALDRAGRLEAIFRLVADGLIARPGRERSCR